MTVLPTIGTPDAQTAFEQLRTLIQQWRDIGRITTTAGLKPAMQEALGGFSEQQYGFETFRDFAIAAQDSGWVRVMRLPSGHTLLGLPDETQEVLEQLAGMTKAAESSVASSATAVGLGNRSLKSDVWSVFLDWRNDVRRLWDRQARHAFMYPVDDDDRPAWETNGERFVQIPPVTFGQQVVWMREWADTLPEPARRLLKASLSDTAPKGEFRRELTRLGMNTQWRAELQQKVFEQVATWAAHVNAPLMHMIDNRATGAATVATTSPVPGRTVPPKVQSSTVKREQPVVQLPATQVEHAAPVSDLERLRQRMHRAIDQMSLAELAALPIRAEHFLFGD